MTILKVDKVRPLIQEAIVTKLTVTTQSTESYQMQASYTEKKPDFRDPDIRETPMTNLLCPTTFLL